MEDDIDGALLAAAADGRLGCPQALELAERLGVEPRRLGRAADRLGIRIKACQLGCFDKNGKPCAAAGPAPRQRPQDQPAAQPPAGARPVAVLRWRNREEGEDTDLVAAEGECTLVVNDRPLVSLLCTPADLDAMAVGFLLSEGLLARREHLEEITVNDTTVRVRLAGLPTDFEQRFHKKTLTSGCGQGITFTDTNALRQAPMIRSPLRCTVGALTALMRDFAGASNLFRATGGSHCAALVLDDEIRLLAEDIGRHNAVDKLIGKAWLAGLPLARAVLLCSGRISGEIMTKVVRNRIPILVSRAAPTCMSVTLAEEHGVTLVGFARGSRCNVYTHPQRIRHAL